jgi:hypothetical protein
MFVTALSEYDQTLFEENSVNRMVCEQAALCASLGVMPWCGVWLQVEALDLFEQTCNENAFVNSAMILFLNKSDLYAEKVRAGRGWQSKMK